jgi:hypothetical protein
MRRVGVLSFIFIFLFVSALPVFADEIDQLKGEIQQLMKRLDDLEKKQKESSTKAAEAEKKVEEVAKKTEKIEKKSLKDRIDWGGEIRFRMVTENATTDRNFYGVGQTSSNREWQDKTSFPLRIRLNAHAEAVQDWLDVYARLTMNKRWGAWDSKATDPFNRPNSFEASAGHDMDARFEQAYMTLKLPWINSMWYVGRLPGEDGAPQRSARSIFPRPFIDSEIDGTLIAWTAPDTGLDKVSLPWASTRLWGTQSEPGKAPTLKSYEAKVKDRTGILFGYLKYDEEKLQLEQDEDTKADADAYLAQVQVKVGKDTEVIMSGLYMEDWHMPNTSGLSYVPDLRTDYYLGGAYVDTQLLGFMLYGAYYYSHFKIPDHSFKPGGTGDTVDVDGKGYPGHLWFAGFNTGDLIHPNHQLTVEFADGSDGWINPFNYRGFRRKGTMSSPAGNYFYDPSGKGTVGFYPFNAQVWDIYYDYYLKSNLRFRLGYMDFMYTKHDKDDGEDFAVLGSSKYQHDYYPYFEVNVSF